jgi:hypothetical protein
MFPCNLCFEDTKTHSKQLFNNTSKSYMNNWLMAMKLIRVIIGHEIVTARIIFFLKCKKIIFSLLKKN